MNERMSHEASAYYQSIVFGRKDLLFDHHPTVDELRTNDLWKDIKKEAGLPDEINEVIVWKNND